MPSTPLRASIVVPTFNRKLLLQQTLTCLLQQSLPPIEIIVIDDGSTDGTADIVRQFPVIYHRLDHGGPNRARRRGLQEARGDWVAFCDDDDLWQPGVLAAFGAAITPEHDFAFANYIEVRADKWGSWDKFSTAPKSFFTLPGPFYRRMLSFLPALPSTSLVRRQYALAIGGFDACMDDSISEDWEFTLRCNQTGPAAVVAAPLIGIRRDGASRSSDKLRTLVGDLHVLRHAREHHLSAKLHRDEIDRQIRRRAEDALHCAFTIGDKALVRSLGTLLAPNATWQQQLKLALAASPLPSAWLRTISALHKPSRGIDKAALRSMPANAGSRNSG